MKTVSTAKQASSLMSVYNEFQFAYSIHPCMHDHSASTNSGTIGSHACRAGIWEDCILCKFLSAVAFHRKGFHLVRQSLTEDGHCVAQLTKQSAGIKQAAQPSPGDCTCTGMQFHLAASCASLCTASSAFTKTVFSFSFWHQRYVHVLGH